MSLSASDIENIEAIKSLIQADMRVHHTVGYLAGLAGMSESRLKEGFKQVVKTSLYGYLKKNRMMLAAEILEQGNNSLKQVAKFTGFKYYSNFTRAFKKHFGITPGAYRSKLKKSDC